MRQWMFLVIFLFGINFSNLEAKKHQQEIAVATMFQNEGPYLREWLEYYQLLGVEHFYLYNNLSTDNFQEILEPYIQRGVVTLIDWPFPSQNNPEYVEVQCNCYRDAHKRTKGKAKWLAMIDLDEFIVPIQVDTLNAWLKKYEKKKNLGGVCVKWVFFGTSGVQSINEDDLQIESLILNGGAIQGDFWSQGAYKSIIRPERVKRINSPHYAIYKKGYQHRAVDYDSAQINHYWTRDEHFFHQVKIPRRAVWDCSSETSLQWAAGMDQHNALSVPILRFIDPLRKRMQQQS